MHRVCDRHLPVQKTRAGDMTESGELILEDGVAVTQETVKKTNFQHGLASGNVSLSIEFVFHQTLQEKCLLHQDAAVSQTVACITE